MPPNQPIEHEAKCKYSIQDQTCDKPVTAHVILPGRLQFLACEEHLMYAKTQPYDQIHNFGPYCSNPRAMWFPEESICRIPRNEAELAIGIFLFA